MKNRIKRPGEAAVSRSRASLPRPPDVSPNWRRLSWRRRASPRWRRWIWRPGWLSGWSSGPPWGSSCGCCQSHPTGSSRPWREHELRRAWLWNSKHQLLFSSLNFAVLLIPSVLSLHGGVVVLLSELHRVHQLAHVLAQHLVSQLHLPVGVGGEGGDQSVHGRQEFT